MSIQDPQIERYLSFRPADFAVLVRLEIKQTVPPDIPFGALGLEVELRPWKIEDRRRLRLSFQGVTKLQLKQEWSELVFPLIEIQPITEHQWEHLDYRVHETEDDALSFYCRGFQVELTDA